MLICKSPHKKRCSFFGVPDDGGVRVGRITKGGLFQKYGIQKGDFIYKFNGIPVDRYGYITVDWCQDRVHLYDALDRLDLGDSFVLTVYQKNDKELFEEKEIVMTIDADEPFAIYEKFPSFECVDYETIGGLVVMELTVNHLNVLVNGLKYNVQNYNALTFPYVTKYIDTKRREDSVLIITHVFAGSIFEKARCFTTWDVIKQVNGIPVNTLQEFRDATKHVVNGKYLTLETQDGSFVATDLDDIVTQEAHLANVHGFTMSKLMSDLSKKNAISQLNASLANSE